MHLSHTRYSVGLKRRIILEITAPSLWCRRSVTNIVLCFLMARKVLEADCLPLLSFSIKLVCVCESHHGFEQAAIRSTVSREGFGELLGTFSHYWLDPQPERSSKNRILGGQGKFQDFRPVCQALLVHLRAHSEGILCGFLL